MKKCIMVGYEEEKLLALRMYAEQRGVSVEEELAQAERQRERLMQQRLEQAHASAPNTVQEARQEITMEYG